MKDFVLYLTFTGGVITFVMTLCNPWFGNKKLLVLTIIPALLTWICGLILFVFM